MENRSLLIYFSDLSQFIDAKLHPRNVHQPSPTNPLMYSLLLPGRGSHLSLLILWDVLALVTSLVAMRGSGRWVEEEAKSP